jgi:hypothetical protein
LGCGKEGLPEELVKGSVTDLMIMSQNQVATGHYGGESPTGGSPKEWKKYGSGSARPNGKTRRARAASAQYDKDPEKNSMHTTETSNPGATAPSSSSNFKRGEYSSYAEDSREYCREYRPSDQHKYGANQIDNQGAPNDSQMTDDFYMYEFKCTWCPITVQHNWQTCMYAHNYQDARRNPQLGYGPQPCPHWDKKQRAPMYGQRCPNGVLCPFSHGAKEQLYHPHYFKTVICWDFAHTKEGCPRDRLCAFYHRKRSQRKGGHSVYVSQRHIDYERLLPQDALQFVQQDFGCPPFSSGDKENSGVVAGESGPPGPPHGMNDMPPAENGYPPYWYQEDPRQHHPQIESPVMSPHGGNGPMVMLPPMSSDGSPIHSPVGSPTHMNGPETPIQGAHMWENWPTDQPQSPHGSPVTVADPGRQVMMGQMVPQMPLSPSHQAPMGPPGYNMQGNVMMQGNMMLVPADGPYYTQPSHSQPPPNFAPPRPAPQESDDLMDVRSFDSMDFYDNQQPVSLLPPLGLKMSFGVQQKTSNATTSTGEGTSGSASNSD